MRCIYFAILFVTFGYMPTTLIAQVNQKSEICGVLGKKTVQEYLDHFEKSVNLFVSYSPNQIQLKDSVEFAVDCVTYDVFFKAVLPSNMSLHWMQDKVIAYIELKAPSKRTLNIYGFVISEQTGEKLLSASLYLPSEKRGTTTNSFGYFSLNEVRENEALIVSYVGFKPHFLIIQPNINYYEVQLTPSIELQSIEVIAERQKKFEQLTRPDQISFPNEPYNSGPFLGGEPDILKMVQQLAGVQSMEVGNGPIVRGGNPDQNLVLLDDVPLYEYNHLFGAVSIFNQDMISRVDFFKGSFPSMYGGRLSSVIDVRTKEGNKHHWQGNITLGLFAQKYQIDGPLNNHKTLTLNSSGRIATLNPLINALNIQELSGFSPEFYDGNIKLTWSMSSKDKFNVLLFRSSDKLTDRSINRSEIAGTSLLSEQIESLSWSNLIGSIKWQRVWNSSTFSNTTFYSNTFDFLTRNAQNYTFFVSGGTTTESYDFVAKSSIQDLGVKSHWEKQFNKSNLLNWGGDFSYHLFRPALRRESRLLDQNEITNLGNVNPLKAWQLNLYLEWDSKISSQLRVISGLRFSQFIIPDKHYSRLLPRLAVVYNADESNSIELGLARTAQFIHLIATPIVGYPTDLWVPSTSSVPPQVSNMVHLNYQRIFKDAWQFQTSIFARRFSNIIALDDGSTPASNLSEDWESQVVNGSGSAIGWELGIEKSKGKLQGGIQYTLSKSVRGFDGVNFDKEFPSNFDRLHDLKLRVNYHFNNKVQLTALWTLASGLPFTVGFYTFDPQGPPGVNYPPAVFVENRNNLRMPWLHRLDLGFNFERSSENFSHLWTVGVYNLYNRFNPFSVQVIPETSSQQILLKERSLYPILPFLNYKLSF
jgi:hypothetical protein